MFFDIITSIDFIEYCINSLFNFSVCVMLYYTTNLVKLGRNKIIVLIVAALFLSLLLSFIRVYDKQIGQMLSYIVMTIIFPLIAARYGSIQMVNSFICVSLMHILRLLSIIVISGIIGGLQIAPSNGVNIVGYFLIGLCEIMFAVLFIKVKRFKNGLQFFQRINHIGLGLALSGLVFVLTCLDFTKDYMNDFIYTIILIGFAISGFGLYLWIRRSITAHYRERLQLKSEEHYQALLSEKEQEIEKLNQSNEYLAKVVHRDNHLMSSLNSSIDAYFASGDSQFRDEMLRDIQTLAKERGELIAKEQREAKILPSTGNPLLDGAINDLYTKAAAYGIDFSLTVAAPVGEVIGKFISQTDLQTLICDHIKDALIAVNATGEDKGKILVEFAMKNGSYSVTVFDSGIAFEPETLAKLGKERVTTHADNGGSGIGFMTTFETLRKAHAGLKITEFETKTPFTKSVSFRFNGENTFTIQSYRSDMLREVLQREDIVIL